MRKNKKFNRYSEYDTLLEGGAPDEEKPEPEEEKPKSEKPKSEKPVEEEKKEEDPNEDPYSPPVLEECCCCECVCANEFTKGTTCCICFPIKCGAVACATITVFVTIVLFVWHFFCFLNEYLHWWYALVCVIIMIPLLVSAAFCVTWFTGDTKTTRGLLFTSQILALVSTLLLCIWNICYFVWIYKKDVFYQGMGEISKNYYASQSKKVFLFTLVAEQVLLILFFCYACSVTSTYAELMHGPQEEDAGAADAEKEGGLINKAKGKGKGKK